MPAHYGSSKTECNLNGENHHWEPIQTHDCTVAQMHFVLRARLRPRQSSVVSHGVCERTHPTSKLRACVQSFARRSFPSSGARNWHPAQARPQCDAFSSRFHVAQLNKLTCVSTVPKKAHENVCTCTCLATNHRLNIAPSRMELDAAAAAATSSSSSSSPPRRSCRACAWTKDGHANARTAHADVRARLRCRRSERAYEPKLQFNCGCLIVIYVLRNDIFRCTFASQPDPSHPMTSRADQDEQPHTHTHTQTQDLSHMCVFA